MAKITRFFCVFACVLAFAAGAFALDSRLADFDKSFETASKSRKIELYNTLRNLYVQSIINDDETLKKDVLPRLVKSSKALGMEHSLYQKELDALKLTQKSEKVASNSNLKKREATAQKSTAAVSNLKLKITAVETSPTELILTLNRPLNSGELKYFDLGGQDEHRRVYNIKATLPSPPPKIGKTFAQNTRVSQFDPQTARVVFSTKVRQNIEHETYENKVIFRLAGKTAAANENKTAATNSNLKNTDASEKTTAKTSANTGKKPAAVEPKPMKITEKQQKSAGSSDLSAKFRASKIVVLDAGHGGHDAGAVGAKKLQEKNVVLNIAQKAGKILKNRGYKVYLTRGSDRFIKLRDRTAFANKKNADLFISIHANAAPNKEKARSMHGLETFFLSPSRSERSMSVANLENRADTEEMNYFTKVSFLNFLNREKIIASNKLAIDVQSAMLKSVRTRHKTADGGVREAPFWVLVGAQMPAILVETGYITHETEGPLLADEAYANALAKGIADGIDDYFAKNK